MLSIFSSNFPENETKEDQRDVWKSLKWEITECIKTFCLRKLVRLMGDHFRQHRKERGGGGGYLKNYFLSFQGELFNKLFKFDSFAAAESCD